MPVEFDKETHAYTLDGETIPSVTQMIKALYGGYEGVPRDMLESAADKGTLIHDEIRVYEDTGKEGFSDELAAYIALKKSRGFVAESVETMICGCTSFGHFGGTYDMLLMDGTVVDFKSGSRVDRVKAQVQLSLYAYALRNAGKKAVNGAVIHLRGENAEWIDVPLLSDAECEELVRKYYAGETCRTEVATMLEALPVSAVDKLIGIERQIAEAEEAKKVLHEAIKAEMETRGIFRYDDGKLSITYVAPSTRESVDTKALKAAEPAVAAKYLKTSASVRVKVL